MSAKAKTISIAEKVMAEIQESYLAMNRSWADFALRLRKFHDSELWQVWDTNFARCCEMNFPGISKHTICKILRVTDEFSSELTSSELASLDAVYDLTRLKGLIEKNQFNELKKKVFSGVVTRADLRSIIREKKDPLAPIIFDVRLTEHEVRSIIKVLQDSNKPSLALRVKAQSKRRYL